MKRNLMLFIGTFIAGAVFGQGPTNGATVPITIPNTNLFTLTSNEVGEDYYVKVFLPENYDEHGKAYPVLYLLDGDYAFSMATDIVTYLQYGKHLPEMIIVSPTYHDRAGPEDGGKNQRRRDYSPFKWGLQPKNPGAETFYRFFANELVPYIDEHYHTDKDDRTIWGYSRSGLFVLWTLFEKPGMFKRFVAIDTGFKLFKELEEKYASNHTALEAHLYAGYGKLGGGKKDLKLLKQIEERNYEGLTYKYEALQGESHFVIPSAGLALGLRYVFE